MSHIEELLLNMLRRALPYYVLAWLAAAGASAVALHYAWHAFDNAKRQDGNSGHATIDFGGQYLMGRMLVTGNGRRLYNRHVQHVVLREIYPEEDCQPTDPEETTEKGDAEKMMSWTMGDGNDDPARHTLGSLVTPLAAADPWQAAAYVLANEEEWTTERLRNAAHPVGGPLYPPVSALFNAPLALMPARTAYRVQQLFNLLLVFVAAGGASYLARGRVWLPVLAPAVMLFPGYAGSINLGQNATLTLAIVVWGWALAARGRPVLGGAVWGLLAFKPVWALAFFLVPLLSRRWRMGLAMLGAGAALGLLTLPFVGVQSWFDWLKIGKEAAELYDVERNWIFLSRDLLSVPRRWLFDFGEGSSNDLRRHALLWPWTRWQMPASLAALVIGWGLLLFVLESTVRLAVLRRRQATAPDGPPAAFLFLAAWMCCFHFMYYDALLGAVGLFLLFTEPRRFLAPLLVVLTPLRNALAGPDVVAYHRPGPPKVLPPAVPLDVTPRAVWALNRMAPTAYGLLLLIHYVFPVLGWGSHWGEPWDTLCLGVVWAWCGWQWLRHGEKVATSWAEPEPAEPDFDVELVAKEQSNGEADNTPLAPLGRGVGGEGPSPQRGEGGIETTSLPAEGAS